MTDDQENNEEQSKERDGLVGAVDSVSDLARNHTFGLGVGLANSLDTMTGRHSEGGAGGGIDRDLP
jgi:hypothetical protein